mmetsp:Transcript_71953/g.227248  ORF Transcript_71953/g.227248 Transcript_71953/m.227248 type:complete len:250 (-) Transcript_71953:187-936(-)
MVPGGRAGDRRGVPHAAQDAAPRLQRGARPLQDLPPEGGGRRPGHGGIPGLPGKVHAHGDRGHDQDRAREARGPPQRAAGARRRAADHAHRGGGGACNAGVVRVGGGLHGVLPPMPALLGARLQGARPHQRRGEERAVRPPPPGPVLPPQVHQRAHLCGAVRYPLPPRGQGGAAVARRHHRQPDAAHAAAGVRQGPAGPPELHGPGRVPVGPRRRRGRRFPVRAGAGRAALPAGRGGGGARGHRGHPRR